MAVVQAEPTVDITEATRFALLSVVETTSPVDCCFTFLPVETSSSFHAATGTDSTELEKTIKDGTVISNIKA